MALFGQGTLITGGGTLSLEDNQGGSDETDISISGFQTQFGVRGTQDSVQWELATGYSSTDTEVDDSTFEDSSDSNVTFRGGVLWNVAEGFYVGPNFSTNTDIHTLLGVARYSF